MIIDGVEISPLSYTRTNFKTTIKRLKNCYMCPFRQLKDPEHCSKCPRQKLMNEFAIIIDFYFDNLSKAKKEAREIQKENYLNERNN